MTNHDEELVPHMPSDQVVGVELQKWGRDAGIYRGPLDGVSVPPMLIRAWAAVQAAKEEL